VIQIKCGHDLAQARPRTCLALVDRRRQVGRRDARSRSGDVNPSL